MISKLKHWQFDTLLRKSLATHHARIVTLGILAGLFYLPTFLTILIDGVLQGYSTIILNAGFLYLGLNTLYKHRAELAQVTVLRDDRVLGHMLVIGGSFWLPFCRGSASLQAFVWMLILVGIAWSSFSPIVFRKFPLSCTLILIGVYPNLVFISNRLLRVLTGPYLFENLMAWAGKHTLRLIGQPAVAEGRFLSLPEGSVEVASGCTGFDMAFVLVGLSFVLGLILNQSWQKISFAMAVSTAIAFVLNVPRIVLLVFAVVYWGEESFDFWHGFWGGQIFSTIMFTAYYYAIMAIYKLNHKHSSAT